jgi:hypothetical protein
MKGSLQLHKLQTTEYVITKCCKVVLEGPERNEDSQGK